MIDPIFHLISEEQTPTYGKFILEPLHQGFGHTLGSALRRILLSHIPGAAPTFVKIEGVSHQFTTISGLKEDTVDLILNIKNLRVKYQGEQPTTLTLSAKGPGDIAASQIDCPSEVEIANPDLVIAHLATAKDKLNLEITVESGSGYSPSEEHTTSQIGVVPVDATFSPITRVNYQVSDTRVGRLTNFDKLTLEIWTDGTIDPKDALLEATQLLKKFLDQLISPNENIQLPPRPSLQVMPEAFHLTVEELELPTRIANALRKAGLGTVKKLADTPRSQITKVKNLGDKSLKIIETALKDKGVELQPEK
jgi:DNA-directed RNA polymerase subunit alpha